MLEAVKRQLIQGKTLIAFTVIRATGQGLGMILPLVFAKFFSPEIYASYILSSMVIFLFISLLISSTHTAFIVFANQEKSESGKVNQSFSVEVLLLGFSFCIFAFLIITFSRQVTAFAGINYGDLVFVSLAFFGISIKTFLGSLFLAMGQRLKNALVEFVFGFLVISFTILFWLFYEIDIRSVFLIYFISSALVFVGFLKTIDFKLPFPFNLKREKFRGIFDFSKWVFWSTAALYFIDWGDKIILRYLVERSDVGVYSFGFQIFKGLVVLFSVLGVYFLSFISQNIDKPEKIKDFLYHKRPKILLMTVIVLAGIYFVFPFAIKIIYDDYKGSETVFRILLPAVALYVYSSFYSTVFYALKKYRFVQIIRISQVLINVLLNLTLVPLLGMYGAAIATVIVYLIYAIALELYYRLKLKKQINYMS